MEVEDRLKPRVCKQALACTLELLEVVGQVAEQARQADMVVQLP